MGGAGGAGGGRGARAQAEAVARHSSATLTPVLAWVPPGGELAARQPCPALVRIWHDAAWQRLLAALEAAWGEFPADLSFPPAVQPPQPGPAPAPPPPRPHALPTLASAPLAM